MNGVEDNVSREGTAVPMARDSARTLLLWGSMGAGLLGLALALRALSFRFEYGLSNLARPIVLLVVLYSAMGILYLVAVWSAIGRGRAETPSGGTRSPEGVRLLFLVGVVGLLLRLAMVGSGPMLEDDFYRYLFDGAMTANGHNPYSHAPRTVLEGTRDHVPDDVRALGARSGVVGHRINHARLRTVYPPVAQGVRRNSSNSESRNAADPEIDNHSVGSHWYSSSTPLCKSSPAFWTKVPVTPVVSDTGFAATCCSSSNLLW